MERTFSPADKPNTPVSQPEATTNTITGGVEPDHDASMQQLTGTHRGWPDILVAALLWGFPLAIPLSYFVLDYPTLAVWAGSWNSALVIGTIALLLVLWRIPERIGVEPARARQVRAYLLPGIYGILWTVLVFIFPDYYGFRYWGMVIQCVGWLVVVSAMMIVFARRWRRDANRFERRLGEKGLGVVALLCTFLPVMLFGLSFAVISDASARPFKIARAAAPWKTQFETAQRAARNLDKDAVLSVVSADPNSGFQHDFNVALLVRWYFDTPSGKNIFVGMRDTDPEATVKAEWDQGTNFQPTSLEGTVKEGMSWGAVNIGPRDAFNKILSDLSQHLASNGGTYSLSIEGRLPKGDAVSTSSGSGNGIRWKVTYFGYGITPTTDVSYVIDGQSGELVDRIPGK